MTGGGSGVGQAACHLYTHIHMKQGPAARSLSKDFVFGLHHIPTEKVRSQ